MLLAVLVLKFRLFLQKKKLFCSKSMNAISLKESPWQWTIQTDEAAVASAHSCTWMPWGPGKECNFTYILTDIIWRLVRSCITLNSWTPGLQFEPILLYINLSIPCLVSNNKTVPSKLFQMVNSNTLKGGPRQNKLPDPGPRLQKLEEFRNPEFSHSGVQSWTPELLNSWMPEHLEQLQASARMWPEGGLREKHMQQLNLQLHPWVVVDE